MCHLGEFKYRKAVCIKTLHALVLEREPFEILQQLNFVWRFFASLRHFIFHGKDGVLRFSQGLIWV